ncbi:hypothetical protein CHUAL_005096 [Chamberlinius hualienensis]
MTTVDVFVGNYTIIDKEIYGLWLDGYSAQETVSILKQRGILIETGATIELLMSDTLVHYRTFQMLERMMQYPNKFSEQLVFQIDPKTQRHLIEKYYELDHSVVREVLGRKLSTRFRKDLDEVSDKTNVSVKSCRRQFDNIKRVFKAVEDLRGRLVHNIRNHFLISETLAKKYAAIVFITNNRFETGKRKLHYLTFDDFLHCATEMISKWSGHSNCRQDDSDADLDRECLQEFRILKILTEKDILEDHKILVCIRLKDKLSDRMFAEMESNFKNISRTLVNIACGLNHSRESRDIFVDFLEKFIEPCKQAKWTKGDMSTFFTIYMEAVHDLDIVKNSSQLKEVWDRYITTASSCILCMFSTRQI